MWTASAANLSNTILPAEPVKPDMKARRSSQLAMYSLYRLIIGKFTEVLLITTLTSINQSINNRLIDKMTTHFDTQWEI